MLGALGRRQVHRRIKWVFVKRPIAQLAHILAGFAIETDEFGWKIDGIKVTVHVTLHEPLGILFGETVFVTPEAVS